MSAGLRNGRISQAEQADLGCFQSQNEPETTQNTVYHNMSMGSGDIHTQSHERLKQFGFRPLLKNCSRAALTGEDWKRLQLQGAFFSMN